MTKAKIIVYNIFIALLLFSLIAILKIPINRSFSIQLSYTLVFVVGVVIREIRLSLGVFLGFFLPVLITGFNQVTLFSSLLALFIFSFISLTKISDSQRFNNNALIIMGAILWIVSLSLIDIFVSDSSIWYEAILNNSIILIINSLFSIILAPLVQYIRSQIPKTLEG